MQLPENVVQIGEPDDFYKVFIEDYVYTYIRQFEKEPSNKRIRLYLFGKILSGEQTGYFYVYGAADSEKGILSTQHEFFPEYDIIGIMSLYHGEKEISLQNGTMFPLNGYFVFYEQNEAMQSFLVHNYHEKETEEKTVSEETAPYHYGMAQRTAQRATYGKNNSSYIKNENTQGKSSRKGEGLYIAAGSIAIIICIVAITTINRYDEMKNFNQEVLEAMHLGEQEQSPDELSQNINIEEIYETNPESAFDMPTTETVEAQSGESIPTETTTAAENMDTEETIQEETTPVAAVQKTTYVIKSGDTFQKICRKYYGSEQYVKAVCEENGIDDPDNIIQGQKIVLP